MPVLTPHVKRLLSASLVAAALVGLQACSEDAPRRGISQAALEAVCVPKGGAIETESWQCGDDLTVSCTSPAGATVDDIYVEVPAAPGCKAADLIVNEPGPFAVGQHAIVVSDGGTEVCTSTLTVQDNDAPSATTTELTLWPPNHKLHRIVPEDCVVASDTCDDAVEVWFTYAASDEPFNALGDGNHEPDIVDLDCDGVSLRAERQGGNNGRVYTLGWTARDDAGNTTDGTCKVRVQHDQSGRVAIEDSEAERVNLTQTQCIPPNTGGGGSGGTPAGGGAGGAGGSEPIPVPK